MNPLEYLLPALYNVLTQGLIAPDGGGYMAVYTATYGGSGQAKPLVLDGKPISVYQHLPPSNIGNRYVLLDQPDCNRAGGSQGCKVWEATVLLDCVTLFTPGRASSIPADKLAGLLAERIDGVVLALGGGLQASPGEVEQILARRDTFDGEKTDVHRYLRWRTELTLNS